MQRFPVHSQQMVTISLAGPLGEIIDVDITDLTDGVTWQAYPEGEVAVIPVGHSVGLRVSMINNGDASAIFYFEIYDEDTGQLLASDDSIYEINPGGTWTVTADVFNIGLMPAKDWHLRIDCGV